MAIKSLQLVADFETTVNPQDVRVWAGAAVDIETLETVYMGTSIDDFFKFLRHKNTKCYYHNLKFDGEFIISYLLLNGFRYSKKVEPGTFNTLITDTGLFYSITVIFDVKNKKYKKVTFLDSLKKLPFKVDTISKAFNLPDKKLIIDYKAERPVGHVLTPEEEEYIRKDCRIVANALQIQFDKGLKQMTTSSDAMHNFKELIGDKRFEYYFPKFPVEMDSQIRLAYKGGFTWLNKKYVGRRGLKGLCLDVNSLYPWVLYSQLLPWGYPVYFEGEYQEDERYPLYIVHMKCSFTLRKGFIPTIQIKKGFRFNPIEYLEDSDGQIVDLYLTSVDLALFKEHYIVENESYICGWKFKGITGLFTEYIDYWMHIKETETGALRQLAKLMLNSLYGKFATATKAGEKIPYLDENGVVKYMFSDDDRLPYDLQEYFKEHGEREPVYTALAAFCTAYARNKTIRSAQSVYDRIIYCDTDSLHIVGYELPEGLEVHPTHLGAWKLEGKYVDSKYIRAKTYMETMVDEKPRGLENYAKLLNSEKIETVKHIGDVMQFTFTEVKCAGMPDNVKLDVTYDNFHVGAVFNGKLTPRRYKGGVILEETTFTIK